MASKHTRIKRSIEELKNFLEYYADEYRDAYKNIRPGQGWGIENFADEIYDLLNNIYGNLYDGLYQKLIEESPATDEEILNQIKSILVYFEESKTLFEKIEKKSDEKVLSLVESLVLDLVSKATYKLKEVIMLAEDDMKNFRTTTSDLKFEKKEQDLLIGIITATLNEHNSVMSLLKNHVISPFDEKDSNTYYEGFFEKENKRIKVVLTKTHHQGIPAASTTTTKLILKYNPKVIFMVGHQAGNKNLKDTHKLGHILIGEESVDYQQNEIIQKKGDNIVIEERDRKRSININSWLKSQLELFSQNQNILDAIKQGYSNKTKFVDQLKAYVGKIVSGSALLRSTSRFDEIISQNPGLIGLDMETHGVYYACQNTLTQLEPMFVSIKSISDFGEQGVNYEDALKLPSVRQEYACYTSANFIWHFIMNTF